MISSQDILTAAAFAVSDQELRHLICSELDKKSIDTQEIRLALAADFLCDAAFEVTVRLTEKPSITKMIEFDKSTRLELSETGIFQAVFRAYHEQKISKAELEALALRSAVADAIINAMEAGQTSESIAESSIYLVSMRLAEIQKANSKPKSLLKRIFGQA